MSILNSASSQSVYRGYEYYKENRVISYAQISDCEYKGEVKGTNKKPYNVIINTKHVRKSSCDCPFANGNIICKHMVALFFSISSEDLNDYEEWLENYYEEDDSDFDYYEDEYNCYDRYENYNECRSNFIKPLFWDDLLTDFVNNLSEEEIRNILIQELKRDEEYTFNRYLQKEYEKYTSNKNNIYAILELINNRFYKLSHDYDYNYKDYTVKLLSKNDKEKISNVYNSNREIKRQIDRIFLNPELATYDDYKWIVLFYKNNNTLKEIEDYCEKLKSFFDTLKHYSIKNTVPKSNVLIAMYILNDYTSEDTAKLLIKNAKYDEFVDYIIENTKNIKLLYENFYDNVKNERYINKEKIAQIFYKFY